MESIDRKRVLSLFLSVLVAVSVTFLLLSFLSAPSTAAIGPAQAVSVPCLNTSSALEDLVDCICDYMLHRYSVDNRDGFDVPTVAETTQWREVVRQMMEGECDTINLSGYDWGNGFTVTTFTDTPKNNTYCVFMETMYDTYPVGARVTHGWGTFIYNPTYLRELNISAPHAKFETGTATETVGIFKNTRSRTFMMTGAHRYASDVDSGCQSGYKRSDAAHDVAHMFHATVEELMGYYDSHNCKFYHLQFHGMQSCCNGCNVHLSHGSGQCPKSGDKILELRDNLLVYHPSLRICMPCDGTCNLNGTKNVQGRLLNGVPGDQVCDTEATDYSGYFIHIEQRPEYRDPDDWFPAVNDTSWVLPCLTVTKQASPNPIPDGAQLTYTISVTNTGSVDLHAIVIDTLPDHVTTTQPLIWTPTVTAPGGVWMETVVVTVEEGYTGTLINTVQVTTEEGATDRARATVCANVCKIYLPVVLKNYPINITGIICRVAKEDIEGFKLWLPKRLIDAHFTPLGITPPFSATVRPVHPETGALIGEWVSLTVDSYDHSQGMQDWVICELTMKKAVRDALCGGDPGDPDCDLNEIADKPIEEKRDDRTLDRTLRFVIEDE